MTNRCDSVDALIYAYYEMMRTKEVNQMLEKNIDYIEFSMHSMMVTHKPYQVAGIEITGSDPYGYDFLFGNNPFDIPCDVVVIPKKDFDRLQAENEQLKKRLEEFSPAPGYREFLTALYPGEDVEKLVWMTGQLCCGRDLQHALRTDLENYKSVSNAQAKSIYKWKEATGCDTPEEAEKKIEKLKGALRRCNSTMLKELDQEIDKWQKATKCNSPEEAEKKIKLLVDDINVLMRVNDDLM